MLDEPTSSVTPEEIEVLHRASRLAIHQIDEDVAPHQYIVGGWDRDDISEREF